MRKCKDCKYFEWLERDKGRRQKAVEKFNILFEATETEAEDIEFKDETFYEAFHGSCHRFPPDHRKIFNEDWCGEFKSKVCNHAYTAIDTKSCALCGEKK